MLIFALLIKYISDLYNLSMYPSSGAPQESADQPRNAGAASDRSPRPLSNQFVSAASRFARVVAQVSNIPISAVSMRALGSIERHGPQRISYMASYESISQPAMTSAVNRLADDGLVIRQPDPADARAQLVVLTDTGRQLLEEYRQQIAAVIQPKLEHLTADDYATIQRTVEILDALTNDLTGIA